MKKNSKPFWDRNVNAITGWKPARIKVSTEGIESKSLRVLSPDTFKPKGFR